MGREGKYVFSTLAALLSFTRCPTASGVYASLGRTCACVWMCVWKGVAQTQTNKGKLNCPTLGETPLGHFFFFSHQSNSPSRRAQTRHTRQLTMGAWGTFVEIGLVIPFVLLVLLLVPAPSKCVSAERETERAVRPPPPRPSFLLTLFLTPPPPPLPPPNPRPTGPSKPASSG